MTDEVTTSTAQGTEAATQSEAPTDFKEYAKWRATGDLPEKEDTPAAAGTGANATETPAKTEPDSEPEKTQAAEDDDIDETDDVANKGRAGSRRRKLERVMRENEELKRLVAERSAPPQDKPSEPAKAEGKPKLEDFQTLEEYQESLTDWKLDQREKTRADAEAKHARDIAEREAFETWAKRENAAKKAHDDYQEVLDSVKFDTAAPGVPAARQAILESELGAEILYHLAKHPDELKRIAALPPASAAREIGKLEAALQKPSAPENGTPRITGAPKPPPPTGRPSKTSTDSLDDPEVIRDFSRWERLRKAQLRSK